MGAIINSGLNVELDVEVAPLIEAWRLANFRGTEYEQYFHMIKDAKSWLKTDNPHCAPPEHELGEFARSFLLPHAGTFRYSERAAEFYRMVHEEVVPSNPHLYASYNNMFMDGRQNPHYHPMFNPEYPEAPTRIMVFYPVTGGNPLVPDGLTVKIFALEEDDPAIRPARGIVEGTEKTPQHVLHFPAGQIGMAVFKGNNVHYVEGKGIIGSIHVQDVDANNIGNTYDANTVGWKGPRDLNQQVEVKIKNGGVQNPGFSSLCDVFAHHNRQIVKALKTLVHSPDYNSFSPMPENFIFNLRRNLMESLRVPA